jgi:shikimate kinase / 3-dehydroquinate synthase
VKPSIVFVGFMGAGKSTALQAARGAGLSTVEIDGLMEASFGSTIPEAFEQHGEEGFRAREAEVVGTLLEEADDGGAIALGGGSVLSPRIREALGRHTVVWLQVDAAEAWRRIAHSDRPLASSAEDVSRLLDVRLPIYEELADAVVPMGDRHIVRRALPMLRKLHELPAGTKLLWASTAGGDYPVVVGRGLLDCGWWPLESRRFVVYDQAVDEYVDCLQPFEFARDVPSGEHSKSLRTAEGILEDLSAQKMMREDHVVALGGGVVGDLAGFCAHVYQRGVPVVQVPTTIVGQVDSAYGGKTGVDLEGLKNYVGAYHQPSAVIADIDTLSTVPERDLSAGFVEVLKTALLAGGTLWEEVRNLKRIDPVGLDRIIFKCAQFKCAVVAADERDGGLRQMLNLGHTVGHAIESAGGLDDYRHGEAVGLGLLAALRLSDADELRAEVKRILADLGLPTRLVSEAGPEDMVRIVQSDKKRTSKGVGFVLLNEPGAPRIGQLVDPARVEAAVKELQA